MRNRGFRGPIAILDGFRDRRIRTMIGAAALAACGLFPWQASAALIPTTDGTIVYDTVNNISWLANANLAATNRFGLAACKGAGPQPCVYPSGAMQYQAATAWVAAMNAANYLGHTNWQLPTTPNTENSCSKVGANGSSFAFGCTSNALGSLYYNGLGLKAPNTAVPIPNNTVAPFSNFQPYLYWSQTIGGAPADACYASMSCGNATLSFNTGFQGANTVDNFIYVLPMIAGKIAGVPAATGTGLQVNPGGQTVYDPVTNVTWLANANLAASNTFGLPYCTSPTTPAVCVSPDGAMTLAAASQFIANMNAAAYLGQANWQLPPIGQSCSGYACSATGDPMAELYYGQLALTQGTPIVPAPGIAVGFFHDLQPYLYWSCEADTIQDPCGPGVPATNFQFSFSFGNGFLGTDILENEFYVAAYFVGAPADLCTYSFNSGGQAFPSQGGPVTVTITTGASCPWSVGQLPSWITLTSADSGTGPGLVTFNVQANTGGDLSASITIGGASFTVEQEAASIPGLSLIGSMPHIAAKENWTTTFTLVNKSTSSATARLSFFGDPSDASGNGPLTLPLTFPQQPSASGPLLAASLDQTIAANASLIVQTAGPQTPPVQQGSAQLAATGNVDGFAIFHLIPGAQEAVVPMETRNASSYRLAFDNTGGVVLAVAVENVSAQAASIGVVIRDSTGAQIGTPGATLALAGNAHQAFVLPSHFPATANIRGTIEFDTPAGGQISVLGIRTTPLGSSTTLTTIPALASVGTGGGSFAFLASGGDGWQTTFVLVNTGTSAAPATLRFFDPNGNPLSLPLSFPQTGSGTVTQASSVTQTLAGGAMLTVQSAGAPALLTGSAQLTTSGNISGFVIFRYNPTGQEAVVPLESRNAAAYLLAFDNTSGTATGIAVNNVSSGSQTVNIPVVIRDDQGNQLATDSLPLAANGDFSGDLAQSSATLGRVLFPATANIRGTVEFDAPAGVQIGVIGIRTPATHTYTTLPALVK